MSISLTWTDNSNDEDKFLIERRTSGSVFQQIAVATANTTGYTDTNVAASTLYWYRVRALNENGWSTYSNEASAMTSAPAAFDPYDLPNQLWMFEADAIQGLSDGQEVTTWPDGSTNSNDITFPSPTDGGTKPTWETNTFGTEPAVRVGSTDQGEAPVPTVTNSSYTFYMVLNYLADQGSTVGLMHYPNNSTGDSYIAIYVGADLIGTNQIGVEVDFTADDLAAATNGAQLLTLKADKATGQLTLYRNGTQIGTGTGYGSTGWDFDNVVQWFALFGGTAQFEGDVGALFAFSTAHDDTTRGNVETYLMDKYGL